MQGIYTHIPETKYVPREYGVAAILLFLFMVLISSVSVLNLLYFYLLLLLLLLCNSVVPVNFCVRAGFVIGRALFGLHINKLN
jgi:hypothetical protein